MSLNPQFMISPNLQEFYIDDATGLPLSGGFVTYYKDNARSTLKSVYQLVGTSGSYLFTVLPNPLTLSGAGTPLNQSGQDVKVYFNPYDANGNIELYYITVTDSFGNAKLQRQAWPNISGSVSTFEFNYNFIRNPTFYSWSNGTAFNNVRTGSVSTLDFMHDDWTYTMDDPSQTINVLRGTFTAGDNSVDGNPPYYLIYQNVGAGAVSASINSFQQTYKSVQTLNGQTVSASIWINQVSGSVSSFSLTLTQNFGSGGSAPVSTPVIVVPVLTIGSWTKYTGTTNPILPSITGKTIGTNDSLIVSLNMPLNITCEIHISTCRLEAGQQVTGSDEISNDDLQKQTNKIGLYPAWTTGDVKMTLKNVADPDWLMMNNQTIGKPLSNAANQGFAFYNLYSLIWNNINSNIYAPIFDQTGTPTIYGANSEADWQALKQLSLTKALGRVLAGANPSNIALAQKFIKSTNVNVGSNYIQLDDNSSFYDGAPVSFTTTAGTTLPSPIIAATTYYAIQNTSNQMQLALTQSDAAKGIASLVLLSSGTTPGNSVNILGLEDAVHPLGSFLGLDNTVEVYQHNHAAGTLTGNGQFQIAAAAGAGTPSSPLAGTAYTIPITGSTANYGSTTSCNIMQPTTFLNVMIKL